MAGSTKTGLHCHALQVDGSGRPRMQALVQAICNHTLDYAIPRSEIQKAIDRRYGPDHGSTKALVKLQRQAETLFTSLVNSGEGGELLLFCIAEHLLRLPQIICKMDLKTSSQMHYHGADGVHCGVDETTGRLCLYWAESKIYKNADRAIRACLASIAPLLTDEGGGEASRDLQLLQRYMDLDNPGLEAAIKRYLDSEDPAYLQLEFRGLCLVGFDCTAYGSPNESCELQQLRDATLALIPAWKTLIATRTNAEQLSRFGLEIVCVPFPSVNAFRRYFREALRLAPLADPEEDEDSPPDSDAEAGV